jgi:hypothetical protein
MTERSVDPAEGSAEAVIPEDGDEPFDAAERRAGAAHAAALKAQTPPSPVPARTPPNRPSRPTRRSFGVPLSRCRCW